MEPQNRKINNAEASSSPPPGERCCLRGEWRRCSFSLYSPVLTKTLNMRLAWRWPWLTMVLATTGYTSSPTSSAAAAAAAAAATATASPARRLWLLTVASHETGALDNLRRSASHHGVDFRQLGNGTRFTRTGLKLELFMGALMAPAGAIGDDDVVLCADGYDVMIAGDRGELLHAYDSMAAPIVIAGERGCWPQHFCSELGAAQYKPHSFVGPFHYVNSGLVIGTAQALKATMEEILRFPVFEDQEAWTRFYLAHQHSRRVVVDEFGALFLCLTLRNASTEFHFDRMRGRWVDRMTTLAPLVLHGNGNDGIANLMWMVDKHPPPFRLNSTAWQKNISMPMKERDRWWVASDPDSLAPRAEGPLALMNFYYNQGAMAVRSGDVESAKKSFAHVYGLFAQTEGMLSPGQKTVVISALQQNARVIVDWEKETQNHDGDGDDDGHGDSHDAETGYHAPG